MAKSKPIRVALAGNPNSGKTSLFNALTGSRQHVGNYAGVTVEKREGHYVESGQRFEVADLPGTYSLTSYSPEERIAQQELLDGDFDVVVAVVDSTTLKRSLVMVAQLMQVGVNPVLVLNMADEADKSGQKLDSDLLARLLGFPVVHTVGHKGIGVERLKQTIDAAARSPVVVSRLVLGEQLDRAIKAVGEKLAASRLPPVKRSWAATRLLVEDESFTASLRSAGVGVDAALAEAAIRREALQSETRLDISMFVMERYYGFVDGLLREVVLRGPRADARAVSDKIDSVLVNRVLGLPVFLAAMYGIFWLTFTVGDIPMGWIEAGFEALGAWVSGFWPAGSDSHLRSLLVDGIISGVGGVSVFLPNIVLLFLGLALLEDTGYMSRAAFIMDRSMHRFGLHGRSFIPLMSGFGCSIPGIMATRTLENERDRLTTMLVLPLMSCGARLTIWMLLIPAFFAEQWRAPMLWAIYVIGILLALVLALVLRKSILRGEEAPFVMELAPYRLPTIRAVCRKMTERCWIYMRKAGTVILAISILMWVCTAYPKKSSYDVDADIEAGRVQVTAAEAPEALDAARAAAPADVSVITEMELDNMRAAEDLRHSVAGRIGLAIEPALRPLGFDWKMGTAMIGAFAAKEVFVSQMGIVYALGETGESSLSLQEKLSRDYSTLSGFCLMIFLLIATPCMATLAITKRESGSWKWAALQFGGLTGVAYLLALLIYQIGSRIL